MAMGWRRRQREGCLVWSGPRRVRGFGFLGRTRNVCRRRHTYQHQRLDGYLQLPSQAVSSEQSGNLAFDCLATVAWLLVPDAPPGRQFGPAGWETGGLQTGLPGSDPRTVES